MKVNLGQTFPDLHDDFLKELQKIPDDVAIEGNLKKTQFRHMVQIFMTQELLPLESIYHAPTKVYVSDTVHSMLFSYVQVCSMYYSSLLP